MSEQTADNHEEIVRIPQRTIACVRALRGLNPEAVGDVIRSARKLCKRARIVRDFVTEVHYDHIHKLKCSLARLVSPDSIEGEKPMANAFDAKGKLVTETNKPQLDQDGETSKDQHDAAQKPDALPEGEECRCGCGTLVPDDIEGNHLAEKLDSTREELREAKAEVGRLNDDCQRRHKIHRTVLQETCAELRETKQELATSYCVYMAFVADAGRAHAKLADEYQVRHDQCRDLKLGEAKNGERRT